MAILSLLDFDSMTAGAAPSGLPSAWTNQGTAEDFTISAAAADHGALGARLSAPTSYRRFVYTMNSTTSQRVLSAYFNLRTYTNLLYIGEAVSGINNVANWRVNANGTVAIRNGSTAVATSSAVLSTNTWYRSEWMTNAGAATQELRIYAGETTTPLLTLTGALTSSDQTGFYIGLVAASTGSSVDIDTVQIADDWTGPFAAANQAPTANAGPDQTPVEPYSTITLSGSGSDADGTIASYLWEDITSGTVTVPGSGATRTVTAPATVAGIVLTYRLTVTDNSGGTGSDTVNVTVLPHAEWMMQGATLKAIKRADQ